MPTKIKKSPRKIDKLFNTIDAIVDSTNETIVKGRPAFLKHYAEQIPVPP